HAGPHWREVATWAAIVLVGLPALARAAARAPLALAGIALAGLSVIAGRPASPEGHANHGPTGVLILLESARSDYFSVNGYHQPTSPSLERLVAAGGVTFTNAWAHANGTVESVVTILTSVYPHRHGIRSMFHNDDFAQPGLVTLPGVLRQHGYATRVVTDWDGDVTYLNPTVVPGFDQYDVSEFGVVNYVKQVYAQY